jgi:hypothetical protein
MNKMLNEFLCSGERVYVEVDVTKGFMQATEVTTCRPFHKTGWFLYTEADIRMVNMRAAREYKDGSLVTYVISCEAAIA